MPGSKDQKPKKSNPGFIERFQTLIAALLALIAAGIGAFAVFDTTAKQIEARNIERNEQRVALSQNLKVLFAAELNENLTLIESQIGPHIGGISMIKEVGSPPEVRMAVNKIKIKPQEYSRLVYESHMGKTAVLQTKEVECIAAVYAKLHIINRDSDGPLNSDLVPQGESRNLWIMLPEAMRETAICMGIVAKGTSLETIAEERLNGIKDQYAKWREIR